MEGRLEIDLVCRLCPQAAYSPNSTWLITPRHDVTWCVELDTFDTTSTTCNLVCCVICIKLWYVSYSLIYWSIYLLNLILFDGTNRICVCKSIKTTKLVQASTIACLSSAMLEQHGSTCSSRLAQHVERVESWRAKWNLGLSQWFTVRKYRHCLQHGFNIGTFYAIVSIPLYQCL